MKRVTLTLVMVAMFFLIPNTNSVAQKLSGKVFWMATIEVPLGNLADYHALLQKEQIPVMEKYGYKFVGVWQTIVGNIEDVIILGEFDDMNSYNTARRAFIGSDEWKVIGKKVDELGTHTKTAFLNAAPYSKLQ
jgi:hypothetical protein